jgi:hypothetical protein
MKKLLSIFTFALILTVGFSSQPAKAEDVIELYPYDQQACLEGTSDCTKTKLGDSHWDFSYNGANWNIPRAAVQYTSEFVDANNTGIIESTEMTGTDWSSVGGMYINNTDEEVTIAPSNANREDLSGSWRALWAYFDADGKLQMFESFITFENVIFNDGTAEAPDWRLATAEETAAFDAAIAAEEDAPANTEKTHIRLALDDTDTDGYVVEKTGYLDWAIAGTDKTTADVAEWSNILAGDPANVVLPAGWTAISFGTIERSYSPAIKAWGLTFAEAMVDADTANATYSYDDQPAWVNNLAGYDNDAVSEGINMVVDYNSTFDLPIDVTAEWLNMYDETSGTLINSVEKLDYTVDITQDGTVLETITYTWNETNSAYDISGAQTVIDTSVFGSGFVANYNTTTPAGDVDVKSVDIVVGVFPPTFDGIANRYINEMTTIDLMEGITADDGYGNDITSTIELTKPADLNVYSPIPGNYKIDLSFTHHVHFDGLVSAITANGVSYDYDTLNSDAGYGDSDLAIWTDLTDFRDIETVYNMGYLVVGANGTLIAKYDRHDWNYTDASGTVENSEWAKWQDDLVLEDGGFVIVIGASYSYSPRVALKALEIGAPVSFTIGTDDQDFDIVVDGSYMLTVDDITAPKAVVVDENYSFVVGEYDTADDAILANVVGFDFNDDSSDLAMYVSDNGGLLVDTPATYTVEVTVEDAKGNTVVVEFDVTVTAASDVQGLLDAQTLTDVEIQKLIDDATAEEASGCSGSLGVGSAVVAVLAAVGTVGFIFIRKH